MAKVRFKWNRSGYAELLNSAAVQAEIEARAQSIADAANAKIEAIEPANKSLPDPVQVLDFTGKLAKGKTVMTATERGRYFQVTDKVLTKSLDAGRR